MDKYIRNDDENDDNEVYRGESYPGLSNSDFKHQKLSVYGIHEEIENRMAEALNSLSPQERRLFELIYKGFSVKKAAKLMKIKQQTANEYWQKIKEKMQ